MRTPRQNLGRPAAAVAAGLDFEDGFRVESEISIDGGENWFLPVKESNTRGAE